MKANTKYRVGDKFKRGLKIIEIVKIVEDKLYIIKDSENLYSDVYFDRLKKEC